MDGVEVVHAPGEGDDTIAAIAEGNRDVVVVTADRELAERGGSLAARSGETPRVRWRDLAERAEVEWYSEISWQELAEMARRPGSDVDLFAGADGGRPRPRVPPVIILRAD